MIHCGNNVLLLMEVWINEKAHLFDGAVEHNVIHPSVHMLVLHTSSHKAAGQKLTTRNNCSSVHDAAERKNTPLTTSSVSLFTSNSAKYEVINGSCRPPCFYRAGEKNKSTVWSEEEKSGWRGRTETDILKVNAPKTSLTVEFHSQDVSCWWFWSYTAPDSDPKHRF